jgi:hypothetical protein
VLDQEIASAIAFILAAADNPKPYYWQVPQDFFVPAVFFPQPDINSDGFTLSEYSLTFSWFVKFFHKTTEDAQAVGFQVLNALQRRRNFVPLVGQNGEDTGRGFRLRDPSLRPLDCAAQLTLIWESPRPYYRPEYPTSSGIHIALHAKGAYESAVSQIGGFSDA